MSSPSGGTGNPRPPEAGASGPAEHEARIDPIDILVHTHALVDDLHQRVVGRRTTADEETADPLAFDRRIADYEAEILQRNQAATARIRAELQRQSAAAVRDGRPPLAVASKRRIGTNGEDPDADDYGKGVVYKMPSGDKGTPAYAPGYLDQYYPKRHGVAVPSAVVPDYIRARGDRLSAYAAQRNEDGRRFRGWLRRAVGGRALQLVGAVWTMSREPEAALNPSVRGQRLIEKGRDKSVPVRLILGIGGSMMKVVGFADRSTYKISRRPLGRNVAMLDPDGRTGDGFRGEYPFN